MEIQQNQIPKAETKMASKEPALQVDLSTAIKDLENARKESLGDIPNLLAKPVLPEKNDVVELQDEKASIDPEVEKVSKAKMSKLKDFAELAEKASLFEFMMALGGTVLTGGNTDWLSYTHEAFGEFAENHLVAASDDGKQVNPLVKALFTGVSILFGIKRDGKELKTTDDFVKVQEPLIGALNILTSSLSFLVIAFKGLPNAIKGMDKANDYFAEKIPALHFLSTKVLPVFNAGLMWMSGATKRRLAFDMQKHSYSKDNKEEIDGAFTSGAQDYICGMNSAGLMLRQAIGLISPNLAAKLEPVFASWIAGSAMKEGLEAYKGHEDEDPKYQLSNLDRSAFGTGFYNLTKAAVKPLGVDLPALNQLAA